MMLLQLSAAQGPDECCLAVSHALDALCKEAQQAHVSFSIIEEEPGPRAGTLRSVLVSLEGDRAMWLAQRWCGTLQWTCESPYRPRHARKNWFIGAAMFAPVRDMPESEIRFEALRASGPGGQHVNKTDSAIRGTHVASGISVKVQSERSQHANKRLARLLIAHKLDAQQEAQSAGQKAQRRLFHHQIARGNPTRCFTGKGFTPVK
ncbi:Peptide chain release factor homolog [Cronobacter condimenti 1330]|uniref:Peptide chain release factor homolog n=1 Tax=Cronobacter condimenti 1330 TaxID=1073999 RepID=K8A8K5_9ENTR|nr:peptide chain release factor H [Cronobacter condimenti]ALB61766.1 peptide chain release factor-like protein [Cronobacter condimenti 1330]CCJ72069.1 Peptide chain release factor homolog [Cronobacter condimenti 1330]